MNIQHLANQMLNIVSARPALYTDMYMALANYGGCIVFWPGCNQEEIIAALETADSLSAYQARYSMDRNRYDTRETIIYHSYEEAVPNSFQDDANRRRVYVVTRLVQKDNLVEEIKHLAKLLSEVETVSPHSRINPLVLMTAAQYCALQSIGQIKLTPRHIGIGTRDSDVTTVWNVLASLWYDHAPDEFRITFPDVAVSGAPGEVHTFTVPAVVRMERFPRVNTDPVKEHTDKLFTALLGFYKLPKNTSLPQFVKNRAEMLIPLDYDVMKDSAIPGAAPGPNAFINLDLLWYWLAEDKFTDVESVRATYRSACRRYCADVLVKQPAWVQQVVAGLKAIGNYEVMTLDLAHLINETGIPGGYNNAAIAYLEGLGILHRNSIRYSVYFNSIWNAGLELQRIKANELKLLF